jgi:Uma2 family endonuclease
MSTLPKPRLTVEEYLAIEEAAEIKSEFYQGEMFAMAGATYAHSRIASNTGRHLGNLLAERPCGVCDSDMRIHIPQTGLFTYADVIVVCGEPMFLDRKQTTLLNPTLIGEVLSPSTAAYDHGRKFEHYQSIESLREYVLIASDRLSVMVHRRQSESQWLTMTVTSLDAGVDLESLGCRLLLSDVYKKIEFPAKQASVI